MNSSDWLSRSMPLELKAKSMTDAPIVKTKEPFGFVSPPGWSIFRQNSVLVFWVILAGSWFSNSFPHTSLWRFWSPNVSHQLCEASSVVERAKNTGQNLHLLYLTTLTLASVNATSVASVNARNNWLQKNGHVGGNKLCEFWNRWLMLKKPGCETRCNKINWSFRFDCDGSPQCRAKTWTLTKLTFWSFKFNLKRTRGWKPGVWKNQEEHF